jgi:hypothetical protein
MDAQSNASRAVLISGKRQRSRLVQMINPAFRGVGGVRDPFFLPPPNVETQSWYEAREANLLPPMHVGIRPLPQGPGNAGSQVTSSSNTWPRAGPWSPLSVGVNCDVVKEGVNGFLATAEEEWIENLERFWGNLALTAALRAAARPAPRSRSPCARPCRRLPTVRGNPCGIPAGGRSLALPSNPIWRASPGPTAAQHPDKHDQKRAGGCHGKPHAMRRGGIKMLSEQRVARDDLA